MANAKKCDRCGKFYEKNFETGFEGSRIAAGVEFTNSCNAFTFDRRDLCDDCIVQFKRFMAGCELKEE